MAVAPGTILYRPEPALRTTEIGHPAYVQDSEPLAYSDGTRTRVVRLDRAEDPRQTREEVVMEKRIDELANQMASSNSTSRIAPLLLFCLWT